MKNFFKTTLYVSVFALAGVLFQISCSNADQSNQPNAVNVTPIGKIVIAKRPSGSDWQIWTCNYDGTNMTQVPITLPPNVVFNNANLQTNVKLSPDGQKVFFVTISNSGTPNGYPSIHSCDINGANLQEVANLGLVTNMELGGVY